MHKQGRDQSSAMHGLIRSTLFACQLPLFYIHHQVLTSMAQLNACLTGDQEVEGSTPAGSAVFFHGD